MLKIYTSDLKERIRFCEKMRFSDGQGGWTERWREGPEVWAQISPIIGRDGFHPDDLGGGMASGVGYIRRLQPARYRVTVRREIEVPQRAQVLWLSKRFGMTTCPYLILDKRFKCFLMVEVEE